jgi:hypothetical protein
MCITITIMVLAGRKLAEVVSMVPCTRMAAITVDRTVRKHVARTVTGRNAVTPMDLARIRVRVVRMPTDGLLDLNACSRHPAWVVVPIAGLLPVVLVVQDVVGMLTVVRNDLVPLVGPRDRRVRKVGLVVGKLAQAAWSTA